MTRLARGADAAPAIAARGLTRRFGSLTAVDDLSFTVRPGVCVKRCQMLSPAPSASGEPSI